MRPLSPSLTFDPPYVLLTANPNPLAARKDTVGNIEETRKIRLEPRDLRPPARHQPHDVSFQAKAIRLCRRC